MIGNYYYGTGPPQELGGARFPEEWHRAIVVNGSPIDEYFQRETGRMIVRQPLVLTNHTEHVRHSCQRAWRRRIRPGRRGAPRHHPRADRLRRDAEARAVEGAGLVTRDAREVERKKVGLRKARRRKQFSKR